MNDGECFIYYNADTIYSFPELNCNESSTIPEFSTTIRNKYFLSSDGYVHLSTSDIIPANSLTEDYVTHVYHGQFLGDHSSFLLPGTLIILAFFIVIYKWFIRLRG